MSGGGRAIDRGFRNDSDGQWPLPASGSCVRAGCSSKGGSAWSGDVRSRFHGRSDRTCEPCRWPSVRCDARPKPEAKQARPASFDATQQSQPPSQAALYVGLLLKPVLIIPQVICNSPGHSPFYSVSDAPVCQTRRPTQTKTASGKCGAVHF